MKYEEIINNLKKLKEKVAYNSIGRSLLGEEMYSYHVGRFDGPQILLTGGIHAREYISTLFLIKLIDYLNNRNLEGGVYVSPFLNPDGVRLVLEGANFIKDAKLKRFLIDVNGGENFSLYKANANGVDLNVNFDAKWGEGKSNSKFLGKENFIGYYPNSEIENLNIINFLKDVKIDAHLAFHSKGEVIYYGFNKRGKRLEKEGAFVREIEKINGYTPLISKNSSGGLSDYISDKYQVFSATVELGSEKLTHPINENSLDPIFKRNKNIIEPILRYLKRYHM